MSFPNTLTIFINTRIRGYPKLKYQPDMTVPNIKSDSVYFNPLVKLSQQVVNTIPSGYPPTEVVTQFFSKGDFNSLINRTIASRVQKNQTLEEAATNGIIDNNIQVTLDTLFKKNGIFYIRNQPYTIYSHDWTMGDWQVDTKSFEKRIPQTIYGYGLYGARTNTLLDSKTAADELEDFKKNHRTALTGFAVTTELSKFIKEYEPSRTDTATGDLKTTETEAEPIVPKVARNLVTNKLVSQNIVNLDNDANLSSDPVSISILYAVDREYSKDIALNSRVLEPLYRELLQKGQLYNKAKELYDASIDVYGKLADITKINAMSLKKNTGTSSEPLTSSVATTASVFKNKVTYDKMVESIYQIFSNNKKKNISFRAMIDQQETRQKMIEGVTLLESYRLEFLNAFLQATTLLNNKIKTQIDYIRALQNFYAQLYIVKEANYKKNNTDKHHQNILELNVIKTDMLCYRQILQDSQPSSNTKLSNQIQQMIDLVPRIKTRIQTIRDQPTNYVDLLNMYYEYPALLRIDRYQYDNYIFVLLYNEQGIDGEMWSILYYHTRVFSTNLASYLVGKTDATTNRTEEGKIGIVRELWRQYQETYSQHQRDAFLTNLSTLKRPLQKESSLMFDTSESAAYKKQNNDYMRLQSAILLCYNLITIYAHISAIKYARHISFITSRQNMLAIFKKRCNRLTDCYQQIIASGQGIVPYIPPYLFWDNRLATNPEQSLQINQNDCAETTLKIDGLKQTMRALQRHYTNAVDKLVPQLSSMGVRQVCRGMILHQGGDSDDDLEKDVPFTLGERVKRKMVQHFTRFYDQINTILLQSNIEYLCINAEKDGILQRKEDLLHIVESWRVIDNPGGGDCLFLAIADIFNAHLMIQNEISESPFTDNGVFTNASLRRAIADPLYGFQQDKFDAWNAHDYVIHNEVDDPIRMQFQFLIDPKTNQWIGRDPDRIRQVLQTTRYWGDESSLRLLETIFKIKFIVIDTTMPPDGSPLPVGVDVVFQPDPSNKREVFGTIRSYAVNGRNPAEYIIENSDDYQMYPGMIVQQNNIRITPSGLYRIVPNLFDVDIENPNEYTHYAFLLLTTASGGAQHYEIMYSSMHEQVIYDFDSIPDYLKYLVYKSQYKYLEPNRRQATWFYHNDMFLAYFTTVHQMYNLKKLQVLRVSSQASPGRLLRKGPAFVLPPGSSSIQRVGSDSSSSFIGPPSRPDMNGGQGSLRKEPYVNIHRPRDRFHESKLSYYVIIDLELYPGKSIPMNQVPVIACHMRYEKIRQAFADMFGLMYQPIEFYKEGNQSPATLKYHDSSNKDKDKDKEDDKKSETRNDTRKNNVYPYTNRTRRMY